jgi:hypothetical protein
MTNAEFAKKSDWFRQACEHATTHFKNKGSDYKVLPTTRQASKFRNGKGLAYKYQHC